MTGDIRALLSRHLPGYRVHSVTRLGHGLDNMVYEVNDELLVRLGQAADPLSHRQEVGRLAVVRELSPLPVPDVVFADDEAGAIAYRKLGGEPLLRNPLIDPALLAEPLGRFLTAIHGAEPDRMRPLAPLDLYPAPTQLQDAELDYRDVERHVPEDQRPLVERFLRAKPPDEPRSLRFCHNDLGAEHVLVDGEATITGIIDWTDAAITDPAHDFALIYRDLGPEVFELTAAHYGPGLDEDDRGRVRFYARCALIEDLAYGLSTGPGYYADAALAHLPWTFS
ncbi:Predicted kinase, aminoglycoside phosphotransferase (APT) family [Nonomuraea solani]|uniref:Predicted kinase, aminoglycoside phosphotransferase (APT) family n=1 Tax=Nonomuraea solani TaxID=1144553 RepID=A0A1H5TBC1_9ACTN|nr:phosphotransferase [Nonomuraea solani]SEF59468.1 Predicted kinase, aminoglycoside phosphotransferase (APT) family [Nonomuraea solani]